jgi:hypothetical protein
MERRGEIIYPSHLEYLVTELGCFHQDEAAEIAARLTAQGDAMIRGLALGDTGTFNKATDILRIAAKVGTFAPGYSSDEVDLGMDSPVFDAQRAQGRSDGSFVSDEELADLLKAE